MRLFVRLGELPRSKPTLHHGVKIVIHAKANIGSAVRSLWLLAPQPPRPALSSRCDLGSVRLTPKSGRAASLLKESAMCHKRNRLGIPRGRMGHALCHPNEMIQDTTNLIPGTIA